MVVNIEKLKKCTGCLKYLSILKFSKVWDKRQNKYYPRSRCKPCQKKLDRKILKNFKNNNPHYMKKYMDKWEEENKEHRKKYIKDRYNANKEKFLKQFKVWYKKNKHIRKEYNEVYHQKNKDRLNPKALIRTRKRLADPIQYAAWYKTVLIRKKKERKLMLPVVIWSRVKSRLKQWGKDNNFEANDFLMSHIGCSKIFLKEYLTLLFYDHKISGKKMSWENYGKWQIDHIVSLKHFAKQEQDIRRYANHFLNLRPLWKEENQKKGSTLIKGIDHKELIKRVKNLSFSKKIIDNIGDDFSVPYMSGLNPNKPEFKKESVEKAKKLALIVFNISSFRELI